MRTTCSCCSLVLCWVLFSMARAQSPLNPSFETVAGGACQYNIPNATFSANMGNCTGFGVASQLDIINTSCGFGAAQSGSYYVALAIDISNTQNDGFTMTLSAPLVMGNSYTLTYYDRAHASYATNVMEVGISTAAGTFGTLIYTAPLPTISTWTLRSVNFVAPNNGQYLSMRTVAGTYGWNHVDNFQITPALPVEDLQFSGRMLDEDQDQLSWSLPPSAEWSPREIQRMNEAGAFETIVSTTELKDAITSVAVDRGNSLTRRYRMQLTNENGEQQYSSIVELSEQGGTPFDALRWGPNPTQGTICLQPTDRDLSGAQFLVFDLEGRLLFQASPGPSGQTCLDLAHFGNGLRLIQVKLPDGRSYFSKVLVQDGSIPNG